MTRAFPLLNRTVSSAKGRLNHALAYWACFLYFPHIAPYTIPPALPAGLLLLVEKWILRPPSAQRAALVTSDSPLCAKSGHWALW